MWLIRHGATTAPAGVAIGTSDPPLSPEGLGQARALAAELATRPLAAVASSDRIRAIATAEAIAAALGLPVDVEPRLRELDFGAWEGRRLAELWIDEPEAAAAWERDIRVTPPSFGESVPELEARVAAFWRDAKPRLHGEVAVVAHRGSLAVLQALVTGEPLGVTFGDGLQLGSRRWVARS